MRPQVVASKPTRTKRGLGILDPVAVALVRDLDSPMTLCELMARDGRQSIESSQHAFHVARDHCIHNAPIVGGLFGMKRNSWHDTIRP